MKLHILLILSILATCIFCKNNERIGTLHLMDLSTGASCQDGTPTGYYHIPGFGEGKNKYIVYF